MMGTRPMLRLVGGTEPCAMPALDFDSLFERHSAYVARVAARMLGRDDTDVDDVVQEVFFVTLHRLDRIRSAESVRPWLVGVTVRVVRRTLRRRKWRRRLLGEDDASDIPASGVSADQKALLTRIYRTLDDVDTPSRIAWILRYVEGERLEDVATACSCSLATAKRRIASVHELLREVLKDG